MFTGIIKGLGKIIGSEHKDGQVILTIQPPKNWGKINIGDSIAVNGCCLTVAKIKNKCPLFFCQKITIEITNLGSLNTGDSVNLEQAMKISDEFGGHIVQGHVDAVAYCSKIEKKGEGWRFWIDLPKNTPKGIILKGSITLDGISLTVSELKNKKLSVDIIPFTFENTNIQFWKKGTPINIETDVIGKYVENYMTKAKK